MKKRNIAIFLIISILVILGIVKKIQNIYEFPYLYVISDDKKWKAYAYPAYEGGQWTGEMFFLGNKEGDVEKFSIQLNTMEKKIIIMERLNLRSTIFIIRRQMKKL